MEFKLFKKEGQFNGEWYVEAREGLETAEVKIGVDLFDGLQDAIVDAACWLETEECDPEDECNHVYKVAEKVREKKCLYCGEKKKDDNV